MFASDEDQRAEARGCCCSFTTEDSRDDFDCVLSDATSVKTVTCAALGKNNIPGLWHPPALNCISPRPCWEEKYASVVVEQARRFRQDDRVRGPGAAGAVLWLSQRGRRRHHHAAAGRAFA